MGERDVPDDATAKEGVGGGLFGPVEKLVRQHDVAGPVFGLERADGTHADNPRRTKLLHAPDIGPVIQFAGQNTVPAAMPRQEDDLTPGELAGEVTV